MTLVFLAAGAAAASWALVGAVRRLALRRGVLDVPNERSSHTTPTPRGGGLALVLCAAAAWALALAAGAPPRSVFGLGLPALAVAALGGADDVRPLGAGLRLAVQVAAAAAAVWALGAWTAVTLPGLGAVPLGAAGGLVAGLWVVGLTNVYNFMDGIDGIAGLQAVVAGAAWAAVGALGGGLVAGWTGAAMGGAALGFLVHNWAPARVFMGDVGSAFLGFTFAALALVGSDPRLPLAALAFVWPFVFDGGFTLVRRLLRGENVFAAHRSHLYQRLVVTGAGHRAVAALYGALGAVSAAAGLAWLGGAVWLLIGVGAGVPIVLFAALRATAPPQPPVPGASHSPQLEPAGPPGGAV
ncbi:hypothetical protein RQM47_07605 [Rubrivirga sp. S365]|uniref:hypothetical protein n=1 Tax=Rubrivirga sp. S365 TaxID=3076080 RepID=UPI0028C86FDA|nr:hypothetical protein [Rubrivirga sp. S365]MDT7856502.1 hypothetical protein [Rubrivirga sp. S365]